MPDLHAYRLALSEGDTAFDQAMRLVMTEVGEQVGVTIAGNQGSAVVADTTTLRWRMTEAQTCTDRVWTLLWEAPVSGDPNTSWAMTTKVAMDAGRAMVILRWGIVTRTFRMRRIELGLDPPPLLLRLVEALEVREDGQRMAAEPFYVSDQDGAQDLADLLLNPGRVFPVVVISLAGSGCAGGRASLPPVDPHAVARSLVGVAHVVVIDSPLATRALTSSVGPPLAVFDGAVRVYWAGLSPTDDQRDHPLWLPRMLKSLPRSGIRRALLDQIMPAAVIRFSTAALEARISMAADRERRAEIRRLHADASLVGDWERELETAWSENARLVEENEALSGQLAAAHENLRTLTARWATYPGPGAVLPAEVEREPEEPASVEEAVEWAARQCRYLVFLDEAHDSARRATYRQPARVLKALLAVNEATRAWQENQLDGGFRNALAEQGLDYSHRLSPATLGRFPHEYDRTYQGKRVVLGPHIRLGRGSPEACCRIYFYLDETLRLGVVGHVGNHLSDRTSG